MANVRRDLDTGLMTAETLTDVYHRYLECLNERRWDDLGEFVADDVTHNDRPLGLSGYRAMLEDDVRTIPDLRFVADRVVAEGDAVARAQDRRGVLAAGHPCRRRPVGTLTHPPATPGSFLRY
jgi:ketosteroid isomerase-like protein